MSDGILLKGDHDHRWSYVQGCGCRMCHAHEVSVLERKVARKSRPWFKRYAVTVMDNWTPMRTFWTLAGAREFAKQHYGYSYVYAWRDGRWVNQKP